MINQSQSILIVLKGYVLSFLFFFLIFLFIGLSTEGALGNHFSNDAYSHGMADITIDSYTYIDKDYPVAKGDRLIVNDTLIITGNLTLATDAELIINIGAVCIVYGNLEIKNKVNLEVGAHLIVGGNLSTFGSQFTADINSTAAVYVLGTVSSGIDGLNCVDPSTYVPHIDGPCNFGNIISFEDNENNSTGIYDLFVSGDSKKGISPVYTELCGGETATILALDATGNFYQWCDSLGNHLTGENSRSFITSNPGEYFVKIVDPATPADTVISHRAKVVVSNLSANIISEDDTCSLRTGSIIFSDATGGSGSYEYSINGDGGWQTSQSFIDLNAGIYDARVRDALSPDCENVIDAAYVIKGDIEPPTITCPGNQNVSFDTSCEFTLVDYTGLASASDNCDTDVTVTQSPAVGTVITDTTTITLTVTDNAGNSNTCTFDVIPADDTAPTITCPGNVTISADAGLCKASAVNLGNPVTNDNCRIASITNDASEPYTIGNTTVIWTVVDNLGLIATCEQIVSVIPNTMDVVVEPLTDDCQTGETGSQTLITWTINKNYGIGNWNIGYTITGGTAPENGTQTNITGTSTTVEYLLDNETAVSKDITIDITSATDSCGTTDTNTGNNTDTVRYNGVPETGPITTN